MRPAAPSLVKIAAHRVIGYPSQPRPGYADHALRLFGDKSIVPVHVVEVRKIQAALGLVAAPSDKAVVPEAMRHIQRKDIRYRPIADDSVTSPVIFSVPIGDDRPDYRPAALARDVYAANRFRSDYYLNRRAVCGSVMERRWGKRYGPV